MTYDFIHDTFIGKLYDFVWDVYDKITGDVKNSKLKPSLCRDHYTSLYCNLEKEAQDENDLDLTDENISWTKSPFSMFNKDKD